MAFNSGGGRRTISEINVTPLVDVMLVLLVIFMVTAPMLNQSMDLNLPDVAANTAPQIDTQMTISIRKDGQVFVDQVGIDPKKTFKALAVIVSNRNDQPIFLEADEGVAYGVVAKVIGAIQSAGAKKLHLVTEPPTEP